MATSKLSLGSEDIVCTQSGSAIKFGVVTKAFDDESSSEDEDESEDEEAEKRRVSEGYAKVAWFNIAFGGGAQKILRVNSAKNARDEQVVSESKLKLVDRALMPGDAVRRISGLADNHKPQRGFVKGVSIHFDVAMLTNKDARLYDVPSTRFFAPTSYTVGSFCVYNYYLGEIESVNNIIRFELRTGFVYDVKESILKRHSVDLHDRTEKFSYFHKSFFYKGQQLEIDSQVLQQSTCILASLNYDHSQHEGLKRKRFQKVNVLDVITNSVKVAWIVRCYSEYSEKFLSPTKDELPPTTLYRTELKKLLVMRDFLSLNYSLGDNAMMSITSEDIRRMRNVGKKFHCGADIKDHIVDMQTRRLSRGKNSACRVSKKKPGGTRLYHTATIERDSAKSITQKIPSKNRVKDSAEKLVTALQEALRLNGVESGEDELLKSRCIQLYHQAMIMTCRHDYPTLVVETVRLLKNRGQNRELALTRFLLNFKFQDEKESGDTSNSLNIALNDDSLLNTCTTLLNANNSSSCSMSQVRAMEDDDIGSGSKVSPSYCDNEYLGAINIYNYDGTAPSRPTTTADHMSGSDIFGNHEYGVRIADMTYSEHFISESSEDSFKRDQSNEASEIPKFVSVMDASNCLNAILECWSEIVKKKGPDVKSYDTDHGSFPGDLDAYGLFASSNINSATSMSTGGDNEAVILTDDEKDLCEDKENALNGSSVFKDEPCRNMLSLQPGENVAFKIIMIRTAVDILWQDGTLEKNVPSTELEVLHPHQLDENEYFPGDFVLDTRKENAALEAYGVVQSVSFEERTCNVRWFSDAQNDRRTFLSEEVVSVYDICDLENFDLNILDMIARVTNDGEKVVEKSKTLDSNVLTAAAAAAGTKRPAVGTAGVVMDVELTTGFVNVLWMEGYQSLVPHHCLLGISEHDVMSQLTDFSSQEEDDDEEDDEWITLSRPTSTDNSWTTASEGEGEEDIVDDPLDKDEGEVNDRDSERATRSAETDDKTLTAEEETADPDASVRIKLKRDNFESLDVSESVANLSSQFSTAKKFVAHLSDKFEKFQVLPKVVTHRFLHVTDLPASKQFHSSLKKELKVLSSALPDGIMVRTFEDRYDLFSCLIVGAEDTPYEQGLFLFDIKLPPNYPLEPPKVAFLSYASGKLNPNLYEDGNVCLSLLGTWAGKGTEVWSKETSSMLQIFVSLQGLILNKTPYFNEAGYERQRSLQTGQENAKTYNEMVIIRLVETCTAEILSPHETFEQEILQHFRFVAWNLINRLQLWCDTEDSSKIVWPEFPLFPLSSGFRMSLHRELKKFKLAVYKMFKMLPNYDEGVTENAHQGSRVSQATTVRQHLVEETASTASAMHSDASLTLEKLEVTNLRQNIEPLHEDPEKLNVAAAEYVAVEPTMKSPDEDESSMYATSQPEKSFVETMATEDLKTSHSERDDELSSVQMTSSSSEAVTEKSKVAHRKDEVEIEELSEHLQSGANMDEKGEEEKNSELNDLAMESKSSAGDGKSLKKEDARESQEKDKSKSDSSGNDK